MTSPFFVSHHRKTLWFCNVPGKSLRGKMLVKQQSRVRFRQNHRIVLWYWLMPIFGTKTGCTQHRRVMHEYSDYEINNVVIKISTIFVQWIIETKKLQLSISCIVAHSWRSYYISHMIKVFIRNRISCLEKYTHLTALKLHFV